MPFEQVDKCTTLAIILIRFDRFDIEIGTSTVDVLGWNSDLPRGAVIAVSQHLNEGRIGRSHGGRGAIHPPSLFPKRKV